MKANHTGFLVPLVVLLLAAVAHGKESRPRWLGGGPVNRGGAVALRKVASQVTKIEIRQASTGESQVVLTQEDCSRLKGLLSSSEPSNTPTVAGPPWPVVIVFRTRAAGTFVGFLVGQSSLRVNPTAPLSARITVPESETPPVVELALDDPDRWLWKLIEKRLGPTRVKEYQVVERPSIRPELPRAPGH